MFKRLNALNQFPQTFVTNPSELKIYLQYMQDFYSVHRNFDSVNQTDLKQRL
jgi:hypothetical protein